MQYSEHTGEIILLVSDTNSSPIFTLLCKSDGSFPKMNSQRPNIQFSLYKFHYQCMTCTPNIFCFARVSSSAFWMSVYNPRTTANPLDMSLDSTIYKILKGSITYLYSVWRGQCFIQVKYKSNVGHHFDLQLTWYIILSPSPRTNSSGLWLYTNSLETSTWPGSRYLFRLHLKIKCICTRKFSFSNVAFRIAWQHRQTERKPWLIRHLNS